MTELRIMTYGSEEYKRSLELRNIELRLPLGLNIYDEDLSGDERSVHIGAFQSEQLLGVLVLIPYDGIKMKMRQVAVDLTAQGKGIGRLLVAFAEEYCLGNGYEVITLHARKNALLFYEKLGYDTEGDVFEEIGIPHFHMEKYLKINYRIEKMWYYIYIVSAGFLLTGLVGSVRSLYLSLAPILLNGFDDLPPIGHLLNIVGLLPSVVLIVLLILSYKLSGSRKKLGQTKFILGSFAGIYFIKSLIVSVMTLVNIAPLMVGDQMFRDTMLYYQFIPTMIRLLEMVVYAVITFVFLIMPVFKKAD